MGVLMDTGTSTLHGSGRLLPLRISSSLMHCIPLSRTAQPCYGATNILFPAHRLGSLSLAVLTMARLMKVVPGVYPSSFGRLPQVCRSEVATPCHPLRKISANE